MVWYLGLCKHIIKCDLGFQIIHCSKSYVLRHSHRGLGNSTVVINPWYVQCK